MIVKEIDPRPRLNHIYYGMIDRCMNPKNANFFNYGGRGITVWLGWVRDRELFIQWALENGYERNLQIDREDNDKGYFPDNCRWVTNKENCRNTRKNRWATYRGERRLVIEWCESLNLDYVKTMSRINSQGWSIEDAFNPFQEQKPKPMYLFQGEYISQEERHRLIAYYKVILDSSYNFYEGHNQALTKEEKMEYYQRKLDASYNFFDANTVSGDMVAKIQNLSYNTLKISA